MIVEHNVAGHKFTFRVEKGILYNEQNDAICSVMQLERQLDQLRDMVLCADGWTKTRTGYTYWSEQ
jgi:hypothetical protein